MNKNQIECRIAFLKGQKVAAQQLGFNMDMSPQQKEIEYLNRVLENMNGKTL